MASVTSKLNNAVFAKLRESPKNTASDINFTTHFLTHFVIKHPDHEKYEKLYSQLELLCGKKEEIVSEDNEVQELKEFLNADQSNILFLVGSLTSRSAICALDMYHLYYEEKPQQNNKLLDYTEIKENLLLKDIYIENGANAYAFAITAAAYFLQNYDF